ncbi:11638_t:CDS:1, partial [Acaulospora morrowiae]
ERDKMFVDTAKKLMEVKCYTCHEKEHISPDHKDGIKKIQEPFERRNSYPGRNTSYNNRNIGYSRTNNYNRNGSSYNTGYKKRY